MLITNRDFFHKHLVSRIFIIIISIIEGEIEYAYKKTDYLSCN